MRQRRHREIFILKLIAKIALLPLLITAVLVQWIGIFLNEISSIILNILSFIIAITGCQSALWAGNQSGGHEAAGSSLYRLPDSPNRRLVQRSSFNWTVFLVMYKRAATSLRDFISPVYS